MTVTAQILVKNTVTEITRCDHDDGSKRFYCARGTERQNDCNWTQTHNHLVRKRTLNHLPKLA